MTRKAFSLIEVLVAMVIVSLITTTGMFAFKLALNQIDKQDALTFEDAMHFAQLKNLINGTYFYVKEVKDPFTPSLFQYQYIYIKSDTEITFISEAPIFSKKLSLIRLKIKENSLYYMETPIYDKKQDYKNPNFPSDTIEHILLKNIMNAKFEYEKPIDLPKDKKFKTNIPKLVILEFEKDNIPFKYIFDVKYNYYTLKRYLYSKRVVE